MQRILFPIAALAVFALILLLSACGEAPATPPQSAPPHITSRAAPPQGADEHAVKVSPPLEHLAQFAPAQAPAPQRPSAQGQAQRAPSSQSAATDEAAKLPPPTREAAQYSFAPIVKRAAPSVVNVYVRSRVQAFNSPFAGDPFFRRFFGEQFGGQPSERIQSSLGSGVIVSPDGLIVTNSHVVKARGETEIRVALSDKREFDAEVVSLDEKSDIAILKIAGNGEKFPAIEIEDSDSLEVGDLVLAIGNPFGVGQTVTSGIVSALARSEVGRSDAQVFIQTDAAINPGNSGGALVDMAGRLVGINTMIFSKTGGSVGIGFAIPSNLVRLYVDSAETGKKVERPWFGARLEAVTRDIAEGLGLDRVAGAVVSRVSVKGPAAMAGLQERDVIIKVDGFDVTDARSVYYRFTTRGAGNTSEIDVIRAGKPMVLKVALQAPPQAGKNDVQNLTGQHPFDGARVSNILPNLADELGLEEGSGVVVLSVRPGGFAARIFQPGDLIMQVAEQRITSLADLESVLAERKRIWKLTFSRAGRIMELAVRG